MIKEEYELISNTEKLSKYKPGISTSELSRSEAEDAIEVLAEDDYPENVARSSPKSLQKACERRAFKSANRRSIDNIRKTRSSALPATEIVCDDKRHSRVETVSSPDFTDNAGTTDEERSCSNDESKLQRQQRFKLNRMAICYDNLRCICVFLNAFILIFSVMYFACALTFSISEPIWLVVSYSSYVSLMSMFYAVSFCLSTLALCGFYLLWRVSRKIKLFAIVALIFGLVNTIMIFYLDSLQSAIHDNSELQLATTTAQTDEHSKNAWDYFHNTFSCCGVHGFFDWCRRIDHTSIDDDSEVSNNTGTYVCSIPNSCCRYHERRNESCEDQLKSNKFGKSGCILFIQREIYHSGVMYKVLTGSTSAVLILLAATINMLLTYVLK